VGELGMDPSILADFNLLEESLNQPKIDMIKNMKSYLGA